MKKLSTSSTKYLPTENHFKKMAKNQKSIDLTDENVDLNNSVDELVKILEQIKKSNYERENDPNWANNNLEYDLRTTDWILEKVRNSKIYAQNLYAALCNNDFQKKDIWQILTDKTWGCSWRRSGGIIADMRQEGDYIDWYCSGIAGGNEPDVYNNGLDLKRNGYVQEGEVTDEIADDLNKLGWFKANTDKKE